MTREQEVAGEVGIKAMPTFVLFKNGEKVGTVVGADPNKLKVRRCNSALSSLLSRCAGAGIDNGCLGAGRPRAPQRICVDLGRRAFASRPRKIVRLQSSLAIRNRKQQFV
ncbi:hypothetical protein AAT19DRAFT_8921 [Rhodotorula toruloides]|uniref:Thioredoxin domain-containing protein n=1 Tax=Rhodotorula toruloides TaxID=5286 RepID=A0A2T0AIM8_RHOTO|nr:hypothetical protein AAT19DRAFT_8921 [Rhodotorula toruloides]